MSSQRLSTNREKLLPDDFAPRVLERARQLKRRNSILRRVAAGAAVATVALGGIVVWRIELTPRTAMVRAPASYADLDSLTTAADSSEQTQSAAPAGVFFPDAVQVTNFADSNSQSAWHDYDSWWAPNS